MAQRRRSSKSAIVQQQLQAVSTQVTSRRRSLIWAVSNTNELQAAPTGCAETDAQRSLGKHGSKNVWRNWGASDSACGIIITSNSAAEANGGDAADSAGNKDPIQHIYFPMTGQERNRDFHAHFEDIPKDEDLIEDYSCALQKDILAHGRLYISHTHISFNSNILGWTTKLRIVFDEIKSIKKRNTALIFRNGLKICTADDQFVFASLLNRDATYDLITNMWNLANQAKETSTGGIKHKGNQQPSTSRRRKRSPQERQDVEEEGEAEKETEKAKGMTHTQVDKLGRPSKSAANALWSKVRIGLALTALLLFVYIFRRAGFRGGYYKDGNMEGRERFLQALEEVIRVAEARLTVLQNAGE